MSLHTFESFFSSKKDKKNPLHKILINKGWSLNENGRYDFNGDFDVLHSYYGENKLVWKDGIRFPIGYVKGFDNMRMPIKSVKNFPKRIGKYGITLKNVHVSNFLQWKPEVCNGLFEIEHNERLKNLKGLEKMTMNHDLEISNCVELTSLEGCPQMPNNVLLLEGCPNLKSLSSLEGVELLNINEIGTNNFPKIEIEFVKDKARFKIEDYWMELYGYIIENQKYDESFKINWPEKEFNKLPEDYRNMYKSKTSINKYNL